MRGTTGGILQHHQILRLPRKMTVMTDPRHIWNAIYNARNNRWHPPTSPNTAPATQNDCHDWSSSHMKRYLQCAEQQVASSNITKYCACHAKWLSWLILVTYETLFTMRGTTCGILQHHQILRLPCQMTLQNFRNISPKQMKRQLQCATDPKPFREWSKNDPRMIREWNRHSATRLATEVTFHAISRPPQAFCIEKYNTSRSGYHSKFHQILRLPRKVTLQLHQILRLPRKMTLMINPRHTWNAIYNARNNRWHPPTSPTATPNDSPKFQKHFSKTDETSITMRDRSETIPRMIREWSENDPRMKPSLRNPPRNRGYFSRPPQAFCIEKYNISRSGYHSKFHRILRLPRKVTLQLHRILRLPRKMTVMILSWLILVTYETLFTMRGTTGGILQHHQILRLPRKMILQNFTNISPKQMKRQLQCATDPSWIRAWSELDPRMIRAENRHPQPASQPRLLFRTTTSILYWKIQHFALRLSFQISPNTAPATKSDTSTSPNTAPATKSDTWTSPNSAPATKSDTWTSPNSAPATKSDTWTPPNTAPATKSHTTLLYSSLVFATILLRIFSNESNLLRI